jgi:hypothetical protein
MENAKITANMTDKDWEVFTPWIKDMLKMGTVTVTFTKKDGTDRVMNCTLEPSKLPKVEVLEDKKPRKINENTLAVYDLDNQGWRSFTIRSVKRVEFAV